MRIGSLFSGIGGLELGLERAIPEARVVWQVERDPYARRVLEKHWPAARRYEDVQEVGAHNLQAVDLICGGFPCQDISNAGARAGIDGERSGLWREFARILGEMVPKYVVLENVPALLNRGMGRVLADLAALSYDGTWDCIPASALGAPHRRDRWFFVGWHRATSRAIPYTGGKYGDCWRRAKRRSSWNRESILHGKNGPMADSVCLGSESAGSNWWETLSAVGRSIDGFPTGLHRVGVAPWEAGIPRVTINQLNRADRLRCLGNAVVPQVAEVVGQVVVDLERLREPFVAPMPKVVT